jgi:glycine/sarcosine N-methyltransferase
MALGMQKNDQFYDSMANHFHLIFEDWNASMRRQGAVIAKLLPSPEEAGLILDVACGIGTQSLALAALGYSVEGSDISAAEVARAQREAASRGLKCSFRVDDMRTLRTASIGRYGAVIAMDNALPHLDSDDDIRAAFTAMRMRLLPGGKVLVSVRDYARHLKEKHTCTPPVFYSDNGRRRIVFQVWDWIDERRYAVHLYVTQDTAEGWVNYHFTGNYRAVTPDEVAQLANQTGLQQVRILPPGDTSFYQPIIAAQIP